MPAIINPDQTITALFGREGLPKLTAGAYVAVAKSFREQNMRNPTQDEIRRRFNICMKWAKTLRGDMQWGVDRICDTLPQALRSELLGVDFTPSTRQCWMPADGA